MWCVMYSVRIRELLILFFGDVIFLYLALYATLLIRYLEVPSTDLLMQHVDPFSLLFVVWVFVFFISGLYDQHTMIFRARLPERIFKVQAANILLAALFFFVVPVGITPKTNLVLYLFISFGFIMGWRIATVPWLLRRHRKQALLIGGGIEYKELLAEINGNDRYPFKFVDSICVDHADGGKLAEQVFSKLKNKHLAFVIVDVRHHKLGGILPHLYKPIFSNVEFIDLRSLYEEIYERMPLSVLLDPQFVEELAMLPSSPWYAAAKRVIDVVGGIAMAMVTLVAAPFIWFAMRFEGGGELFIRQKRFGLRSVEVSVRKFRSMRTNNAASAAWTKEEKENKVTRVGAILRKVSLDEFPQCLNILSGELSLIGPRSDIEGLGKRLAEEIPLYEYRYVVKPGITGWAQVNQQYEPGNISPQSVEETKMRLMYDFYYIKHRSFMLDIIIALKTLKRMAFRVSSW